MLRKELTSLRMERSDSASLVPWCLGLLALVVALLVVLL